MAFSLTHDFRNRADEDIVSLADESLCDLKTTDGLLDYEKINYPTTLISKEGNNFSRDIQQKVADSERKRDETATIVGGSIGVGESLFELLPLLAGGDALGPGSFIPAVVHGFFCYLISERITQGVWNLASINPQKSRAEQFVKEWGKRSDTLDYHLSKHQAPISRAILLTKDSETGKYSFAYTTFFSSYLAILVPFAGSSKQSLLRQYGLDISGENTFTLSSIGVSLEPFIQREVIGSVKTNSCIGSGQPGNLSVCLMSTESKEESLVLIPYPCPHERGVY